MLPEYDRYKPKDNVTIEVTEDNFSLPRRATQMAVGFDLFATKDCIIRPLDRKLIGTGIKLEMPTGIEGQVRSRSGLAYKHGVFVLNSPGTIDPDYRGEVKVCLWNSADKYCIIHAGECIAQIIFQEVPQFSLKEVASLDDTERGEGGFGSSGL